MKRLSPFQLVVNSLITIIFFPAIVLLAAGDWHWVEGWIFSLWFVVMALSATIYLAVREIPRYWQKDPERDLPQIRKFGTGT